MILKKMLLYEAGETTWATKNRFKRKLISLTCIYVKNTAKINYAPTIILFHQECLHSFLTIDNPFHDIQSNLIMNMIYSSSLRKE